MSMHATKKRKCGAASVVTEEQWAEEVAARNHMDNCLCDLRMQWTKIFSANRVAVDGSNIPTEASINAHTKTPAIYAHTPPLDAHTPPLDAHTKTPGIYAHMPPLDARTEISPSDAAPVLAVRTEISPSDAAPGIDAHAKEVPCIQEFDTTAADDFMRVETHGFVFKPYQTDTRSDPESLHANEPSIQTRQGCVFSV
jgi:hypothetical protein